MKKHNSKETHDSSSMVTVAVVQAASVAFDRKRTLTKVLDLTRDAAKQGAQLVLFPEAFVSGYPRGLDFGAVVGSRSDAGREDFKRYWESAVEVPGLAIAVLSKAARTNSVYLVIGVIERAGGTLYCCVLFFAPDGAFLGKHRKVMPTASERLIWGYGDGSTLPVFETPLGRLGAVICWENYMPLLRTYMYSQGIEIYCAPTADHRDSWVASMRHIAMEGRCFVLGCNQFNRRRDFPKDYKTAFGDAPETILSRGGSCIVDPFGKFLAGPNFEDETILLAELDRGLLPKAKFDFDAVGHYSRPDIFSLIVDDRPKPVVATASAAEKLKARPS
jgi:nitrilase